MKGIRGRLTANFMIVILISVIVLEVLLIYSVKQNYYSSLKANLINQAKISADMYSKYYSDTSLEDNILYDVDAFWNQSNAEVEIVNREGKIIMDSQGIIPGPEEPADDINDALKGKTGGLIGKLNGENVMAIAYPLQSDGQIVGALRLIASTDGIDQDIQNIMRIFIAIGLLVILIVGLLSIFLANTIVVPLREVTNVAEEMARGNFQIKSKKKRDDELGKLSDTLNYMAAEITKKERLKNDFISSVSHELRTPLTSIMGWAITLQSRKLPHQGMLKDGLSIIARESERLTKMVEELLDFSKFIPGKIRLEYKPTDLRALLGYIHKQMAPRAQRADISLTFEYPDELPYLMADANRLQQLFINILDNALNFTPAGGAVRFLTEVSANGYSFAIADDGCGIAAEELPLIKEKFYKGKSSNSKNGIGLSICEEIITQMGGELEITSELGVGTTVYIILPRKVCQDD